MKAKTLDGLREYAFREGSDEDPLSIEVGALIQAYDQLRSVSAGAMHLLEQAADTIALDRGEETTATTKLRACAERLRTLGVQ